MEESVVDNVEVTYADREYLRDEGVCHPVYYYEYCIDARIAALAQVAIEEEHPREYVQLAQIFKEYDPGPQEDEQTAQRRRDMKGEELQRWFTHNRKSCSNFRLLARHRWAGEVDNHFSHYSVRINSSFEKSRFRKLLEERNGAIGDLAKTCTIRMPVDRATPRDEVLLAVRMNPSSIVHADRAFCKDAEIMLAMLSKDGMGLYKYVDASLFDDARIALAVMRLDAAYAFRQITPRLKSDRSFMLDAVRTCPSALYYANKETRDDREIALAAVRKCWAAYQYVSERLKRDVEIGLTAVNRERCLFSGAWGQYIGSHLDK